MKKISILIGIILILIIINLLIYFLPTKNKYETNELKMDLEIGENFGVNLNRDAIHFGRIKKGSSSTFSRDVFITNKANESKTYYLNLQGELARLVKLSENEFILSPKKTKTIKLSLTSDPILDYGNYTGVLIVKSK